MEAAKSSPVDLEPVVTIDDVIWGGCGKCLGDLVGCWQSDVPCFVQW